MPPDLDSLIVISSDLLLSTVGAEAVLLSEQTGCYYGLNASALRIWHVLEQHPLLRAAYDEVLAEYDVEPEQFQRDFLAFVSELAARQFVSLTAATARVD